MRRISKRESLQPSEGAAPMLRLFRGRTSGFLGPGLPTLLPLHRLQHIRRLLAGGGLLILPNQLSILKEIRLARGKSSPSGHSEGLHHFAIHIGQQVVGQVLFLRERLLSGFRIEGNSENLHALLLQFLVCVPQTTRLFGSSRSRCFGIEEKQGPAFSRDLIDLHLLALVVLAQNRGNSFANLQ
jgi:hypothetical protein